MIHTVIMPTKTNDVEILKQVMRFQHALLRFAADRSEEVSKELPEELKKHLVTTLSFSLEQAQKAAKWLTDKGKLLEHFNSFASDANTDEKAAILDDLELDIVLLCEPDESTFQLKFNRGKGSTDPPFKKALGNFCYSFYDYWSGTGFQDFLLNDKLSIEQNYTRALFVDHFVDANSDLYMCPICDATAFRNETGKGTYTSVDHFFPRSIYPHLSIHPYNLLPMCSACNSGVAGQSDPLKDIHSLNELALPYHATGLRDLIYIQLSYRKKDDVDKDEKGANKFPHPLKLSFKSAQTSEEITSPEKIKLFIDGFEEVYKVQKRWNKNLNLTQIDEHVFRRIRQFLLLDIRFGSGLVDPLEVAKRLEILMALVHKDTIGRDVFAFVTVWWLRHHIEQLKGAAGIDVSKVNCEKLEESGFDPLFTELCCWAQGEQEVFKELQERVTTINNLVSKPE